jgi:hypothetical protein
MTPNAFASLAKPGKSYRRERLSTVDLLVKIACFMKEKNNISALKAADFN